MFKIVSRCIREYKRASILTPLLVSGEVILECLIPFVIAMLVNAVKAGSDMPVLLTYGGVLVA
ncbi:MAG: ABC transporter ATP-binding protein, partial [Clostridia bacterium]|nr:ABC transporter ATP-binding protein [Clostridia bacterium]